MSSIAEISQFFFLLGFGDKSMEFLFICPGGKILSKKMSIRLHLTVAKVIAIIVVGSRRKSIHGIVIQIKILFKDDDCSGCWLE